MFRRAISGLVPIKATRVIMASCMLLVFILILSPGACASPTTAPTTAKPSNSIKAIWVEADVVGNTVSIPISEIERKKIIHSRIGTPAGDISFMGYELYGKIYVRADVCPPCRSEQFSLSSDKLVCDTCATVFDAKTGDGVRGACVLFPKASVTYEISNGKVVMKSDALIAAYSDTLKPGWP